MSNAGCLEPNSDCIEDRMMPNSLPTSFKGSFVNSGRFDLGLGYIGGGLLAYDDVEAAEVLCCLVKGICR